MDNVSNINSEFEDDEDEFRSCCGDEEEMGENVEKNDGLGVKMLFTGVSVAGVSGIGVIMEGFGNDDDDDDKVDVIQIQKKVEFVVGDDVVDYLALMDGLCEAVRKDVKRVYAFTNSEVLFDQITNTEVLENPLLMALKQRILEHIKKLEHFVLKYDLNVNLEPPLHLAQVAIGVVCDTKGDATVEKCLICCEDKPAFMMVTLKCSHKYCSHCIKAYVDEKVGLSEVPIRCPSPKCRYYISVAEHKSFLPVDSFMSLEEALLERNNHVSDKFYCPFPDCAVLLDPSSDADSTDNCVKCPVCRRFVCVKCGVPWHSSVSCDDFQEVSVKEMDAIDGDVALDSLVESRRWKRCQMCERMIELTHGCYDLTCWCGHEFCYSCGSEYVNNQPTCECATWADEEEEEENDQLTLTSSTSSDPAQEFEEWAWESFGSLSNMTDAYSDQERSQLALIQRFLAGGFSLSDHHSNPSESPSLCTEDDTSYIDNTIKDLHQLPWLERFVSVMSDNYYDECSQ